MGPGRPIDTDRYFVICANVLGGCMGSTGPRSLRDDGTGPWGTDFPPVTIQDMVRAQKMLIDRLGILRLFAVLGGSMGGMQALQWVASYPDAVFASLRRRSSPIPTGRAGATGKAVGCRRAAWRWHGCARTSPTCRKRR